MFNLIFQKDQKFQAGDKVICPSCKMKAKIVTLKLKIINE